MFLVLIMRLPEPLPPLPPLPPLLFEGGEGGELGLGVGKTGGR